MDPLFWMGLAALAALLTAFSFNRLSFTVFFLLLGGLTAGVLYAEYHYQYVVWLTDRIGMNGFAAVYFAVGLLLALLARSLVRMLTIARPAARVAATPEA